MLSSMSAMKAHVVNGQIILDEPVELPEGAVAEVRLMDDDEESPEERAEIEAAIDEGLADVDAGNVMDFDDYIASLRTRRA
jgi:hypothetical protein